MVLTKAWYFVIFKHFLTCHNAHILAWYFNSVR